VDRARWGEGVGEAFMRELPWKGREEGVVVECPAHNSPSPATHQKGLDRLADRRRLLLKHRGPTERLRSLAHHTVLPCPLVHRCSSSLLPVRPQRFKALACVGLESCPLLSPQWRRPGFDAARGGQALSTPCWKVFQNCGPTSGLILTKGEARRARLALCAPPTKTFRLPLQCCFHAAWIRLKGVVCGRGRSEALCPVLHALLRS